MKKRIINNEFIRVDDDDSFYSEMVHLPNSSNASDYVTLCGLSGDENQHEVTSGPVTCATCFSKWLLCRNYKMSDFDVEKCNE
jgi:hypothetical protein